MSFYAYASIGQQTQDLKYRGEPTYLRIGDGNTFREFVTVHRGTAPGSWTRIGNRGNFLAYSHVAHDCMVGDGVIFSNNGTIGGHVEVEDYAVIGGLTAVHQYCRIGRHAITGGCSKIVQDVPPFMIADGNPARVRGINQVGLERHGFDRGEREAAAGGVPAALSVQDECEAGGRGDPRRRSGGRRRSGNWWGLLRAAGGGLSGGWERMRENGSYERRRVFAEARGL